MMIMMITMMMIMMITMMITMITMMMIMMIMVQEIEKRGLDIIGLYRLCGSETKKKMLREAFETNPEAVDLSSENVPDINVITSEFSLSICQIIMIAMMI